MKDPYTTTVSILDLEIEGLEYQRDLNVKRAEDMADNWKPSLYEPLQIAQDSTTGKFYVVDGQHRWNAMKQQFDSGDTSFEKIEVRLHEETTPAERAWLFLNYQSERKDINQITRFRVGITAGYPECVEVKEVLDELGLVYTGNSAHAVRSTNGLLKIHKLGHKSLVKATLVLLDATWGTKYGNARFQGDILQGVGMFLAANLSNPHVNPARISTILRRGGTPEEWKMEITKRSKGSGGSVGRPKHMKDALVEAYNKGLRNPKNMAV